MKLSSCNLTDKELKELYDHFNGDSSIEEFRSHCKNLINKARVPNQQIIRQIDTMSRKQLTFTMTNFILKGQGLGVK